MPSFDPVSDTINENRLVEAFNSGVSSALETSLQSVIVALLVVTHTSLGQDIALDLVSGNAYLPQCFLVSLQSEHT